MKVFVEKEIIMTSLDDEAVLLNENTGKYYSLKGSGLKIWELLQRHTETEDIFNIMFNEYNVSYNILRHDFDNLIKQLVDSKFLMQV